jgi:2-dehydro-3-deoxyphosphogluconate aldolase/(4S)-4-hydroxy-2-oxoglutarate aldolase
MASASQVTVELVEQTGVVAIIRLKDPAQVRDVAAALMEGGVRALEITMTVPGAIDLIRQIAPTMPADLRLGAGTVIDGPTAAACIDAGASFVVSPVLRREVLTVCRVHDIPVMPGCFSPTEILEAWDAGAAIVKVFPATSLGPTFIRDIRGPLPQLKLLPTGGVSVENAADWIRAGAVAVGVGGALTDAAALAARDYAAIAAKTRRLVNAVRDAKGAC